MKAPQIIYICLMAVCFGIELVKVGKPREGTHNPIAWIVMQGIMIGLLYWGGFFSQ